MLAVLRIAEDGRVIGANEAARALLGEMVGRRCCDAVMAREGRALRCEPTCAVHLARGEASGRSFAGHVAGRLCTVSCSRVGCEVVVVLRLGPEVPLGSETLTAREREVLTWIAAGEPADAIARRLGIHKTTLRTHVERARQKLGARTQAEAVGRALGRGEITLPLPTVEMEDGHAGISNDTELD